MKTLLRKHLGTAICACALTLAPTQLFAQAENSFVHEQSAEDGYEWPTDPLVLKKLDEWRDLKFGAIIHWGLYSVPGIVESWNLCDEDWINRGSDLDYEDWKKWYWGISKDFAPKDFNPNQWADMMKDAGMKYMIFTTKHHDGFCMFDTKQTDFSIANFAFKNDPRRDVAKNVFDAFREKDFMIGCYFSKPDWHCKWFWNPQHSTPTRMQNYKRNLHPDWWNNYVAFTQRQLDELTTNYGDLDILWLDGGWVSGDEIGLDSLLVEARKRHPGLISVDRAIKGRNENYQTPERGVPDHQLNYPWESCITLSHSWAWAPGAHYKSSMWVVNTLAEIVAKGGCFVLGIGPDKNGVYDPAIPKVLAGVGDWLRRYGTAIYATRTVKQYHDGDIWFTGSKDCKKIYAIYCLKDDAEMPQTISWKGNVPGKSLKLVSNGKKVKYTKKGDVVTVTLPKGMKKESFALEIQ